MPYVVNSGGKVHAVTREHFERLLLEPGFRAATEEEIARERPTSTAAPQHSSSAQAPGAPAEQPVLPAEGGGRESAAAPGPGQTPPLKAGAAKRSTRAGRRASGV